MSRASGRRPTPHQPSRPAGGRRARTARDRLGSGAPAVGPDAAPPADAAGTPADLIDLIPGFAWSADPTGRVQRVNRYFLDYTGQTPSEATGDGWTSALHPDDLTRTSERWQRTLLAAEPDTLVCRFRRAQDGGFGWFRARIALVRDPDGSIVAWAGTAIELPEGPAIGAERARRDLIDEPPDLQALIEIIPVGVEVALDPDCRTIKVNSHFARTLGLPPGANASLSAPPKQRPTHFRVLQEGRELAPEELALQRAAAEGIEIREVEVDIVHDGRVIRLHQSAAPLFDEHGRTRGAIGVFIDVTERQQAEVALCRLNEQLRAAHAQAQELTLRAEEARQVAQEAARLREDLVASVSHDLKNPLTTIQGSAQMALRRLQVVEASGFAPVVAGLTTINATAHRMTELIDALIDAARRQPTSHSVGDPRRRPLDLVGLVREVVVRRQQASDRHAITVETDRPVLVALLDAALVDR